MRSVPAAQLAVERFDERIVCGLARAGDPKGGEANSKVTPRWFALQKLWMSEKPERDPQKKPKDRKQGSALLDAVWLTMRHYPIDDAFYGDLPDVLKPHLERWDAQKPQR